MRNLVIILPLFIAFACGESEKEKQERLNKAFNENVSVIQNEGKRKVDSLDNLINANKKADSIQNEINKAIRK